MAKKQLKDRIAEAVAPAKKAAASARKRLAAINKRRLVEAGEVVAGGTIGGVLDGAGVDIEIGADSYPIALPVGAAAVAAGVAMDQADIQAAGIGMLAYGAGKVAADMTRSAMSGSK
ncbi:hypothetical protein L6R53_13980 [Myxococcota bacterium]|nr:hypothetical protein [Myxococcota bacterium]